MMKKTKIEWCDSTWNPVTGCLNDCPYCYARGIANRFASKDEILSIRRKVTAVLVDSPMYSDNGKKAPYPFGFKPTFHRYRLEIPKQWTKPRNIFVCSMADLFGEWIPDWWIQEVINSCNEAPQHNYLFLTKNPGRYMELVEKGILHSQDNFWLGSTVTSESDQFYWNRKARRFVSIEPIMGIFNHTLEPVKKIDWVIIGAETGNRKDKVIPEKEWIENIVNACKETNTPVFMKDSLIPIMGETGMLREFPEGMKVEGAR